MIDWFWLIDCLVIYVVSTVFDHVMATPTIGDILSIDYQTNKDSLSFPPVISTVQTPQGPVADVTQLVADEILQSTLTLQVSIRTAENKNRIRHLRPVLAVFLDLNVSVFHERHKRSVGGDRESAISNITAETYNDCRLVPWTVSFVDLEMHDFIVEPESYLANNCEGNCPADTAMSSYYNTSNHVIFKIKAERSLCCTPIKYKSQSILFFKNNSDSMSRTLDKMAVAQCGCRWPITKTKRTPSSGSGRRDFRFPI